MRVFHPLGRLRAVFAAVALLGCSQGDHHSATGGVDLSKLGNPQSHAAVDTRDVPSDAECEAFASAYEAALADADTDAVNRMIDWDAMLQRVTDNIEAGSGFRDGYIRGVRQGVAKSGLGRQLVDAIQHGGSVKLLRIRDVDGNKRALFRILLHESGVNYHDMVLARGFGGTVRAIDIYVFVSAEMMTQTLRRLYLMAVAGQSRSLLEKLAGAESDFVRHADKYKRVAQQFQLGEYREVLEIYDSLPESLRHEKSVMIFRMQAALHVGDETYAKSMEEFRGLYPHDPCLDMVSIDYYLLREEFAAAQASVDRLDKAVGGDPYLNVLRSGIYVESGELETAHALCESTIERAPDVIGLYWTLIHVTMLEKKFDETARWLTRVGDQFELTFEDLTTQPEYAEFVKSPEYAAWLKGRPQ